MSKGKLMLVCGFASEALSPFGQTSGAHSSLGRRHRCTQQAWTPREIRMSWLWSRRHCQIQVMSVRPFAPLVSCCCSSFFFFFFFGGGGYFQPTCFFFFFFVCVCVFFLACRGQSLRKELSGILEAGSLSSWEESAVRESLEILNLQPKDLPEFLSSPMNEAKRAASGWCVSPWWAPC